MYKYLKINIILLVFPLMLSAGAWAESSSFDSDAEHKVVYDVKTRSLDEFSSVMNRISFLTTRLGNDPLSTSIVWYCTVTRLNISPTTRSLNTRAL